MKSRKWIGIALTLFVVVMGVLLYGVLRDGSGKQSPDAAQPSDLTQFHDKGTGLALAYNDQVARSQPLTKQQKASNVLLSLGDTSDTEDKPFLVSIRYEDGVSEAARITKQSVLDHLENSLSLTLPRKPGYKEESLKRIEVAGHDAIEVVFTYEAQNKTQAKQRLTLIQLSSDKVLYISQQGRVEDFDQLNSQVFQPLIDSIKFD